MSTLAAVSIVLSALLIGTGLHAQEIRPEEPVQAPAPDPRDFPEGIAEIEDELVVRTNAIRRDDGVPPLVVDPTLARLAREHSCRMARQDFFSHTEPAEGDLPSRLRAAGTPFEMVGENIAQTSDTDQPLEAAIQGWMQSPGHRANILQPGFTRTGAGVCRSGPAYFFTQIFLRSGGAWRLEPRSRSSTRAGASTRDSVSRSPSPGRILRSLGALHRRLEAL
jgi:uncharacterized protein YkwD